MVEKEFLSVEETAEHVGVSRSMVYKYISVLKLKPVKFRLDRRTYLAKADVDYIKEIKEKPWLAGLDESLKED